MIEVGEYVRTKKGQIDKVISLDGENIVARCEGHKLWIENIVKHSKNIIDLIEVGDYVNGEKIIEVRNQNGKIYLMTDYVPQKYLKSKITSIVTKEQMASIEYRVKDLLEKEG